MLRSCASKIWIALLAAGFYTAPLYSEGSVFSNISDAFNKVLGRVQDPSSQDMQENKAEEKAGFAEMSKGTPNVEEEAKEPETAPKEADLIDEKNPSSQDMQKNKAEEKAGSAEMSQGTANVEKKSQETKTTTLKKSRKSCYRELGAFAIADWLNSVNIGNFFGLTKKYINDTECFINFNAFSDINIEIEPYGFHSHYRTPTGSGRLDFSLVTFGLSGGGGYAFSDQLSVGGGVGYFHSNLEEKGKYKINGLYFGPYVEYLFSQGYLGFMLYGMGNFYDGKAKICDDKEVKINYHSLDVGARLETGYDFKAPLTFARKVYAHPYLRLDYLAVFEAGHEDSLTKVDSRYSSFLRSKLALRLSRKVVYDRKCFFIPNFDLGWIRMMCLSSECLRVDKKQIRVRPENKDQLGVGLDLAWANDECLLIGLGFEALFFGDAPAQAGRLRAEWNW